MKVHLYLSMIPESLVASMLPPEEFGTYMATGTRKRPHGHAMFFQLKEGFQSDYFNLSDIDTRCVAHSDGQPKHSVYMAVYRVLENVPLEAIESLWLTTAHGQVLEIQQGPTPSKFAPEYHLYQELCPLHPLIASSLDPVRFCKQITDTNKLISVPKMCFVELNLDGLATDPMEGSDKNLPYHNIDHLRSCLNELKPNGPKESKTVDRVWHQSFLYRSVKSGFFVGDNEQILYYPYPSREDLESKYYAWWRCANDAELQYA